MSELEAIDNELAQLNQLLPNVRGRETQIFSRVVGYYGEVSLWNRGKRQEFDERKMFDIGGSVK